MLDNCALKINLQEMPLMLDYYFVDNSYKLDFYKIAIDAKKQKTKTKPA